MIYRLIRHFIQEESVRASCLEILAAFPGNH